MTVGERIKEIRKDNKMTQKEFCKVLEVSRAHIAGIETNKDNPSSSLIKLICLNFDIIDEWLKNGTGEKYSKKNIKQAHIKKSLNINLADDKDTYNLNREKLFKMIEMYGSLENDICFITDQTEQKTIELEEYIKGYCSSSTDNFEDSLYNKIFDLAVSAGEDGFIAGFKFAFSIFNTVNNVKPSRTNFKPF